MKSIAIFYHCLFYLPEPVRLLSDGCEIVKGQMEALKTSGLLDAATEMLVGINGGGESRSIAHVLIPYKARVVFHGLQCRNENLTIRELEKWLPGHDDWYVLYFHAKGATHPIDDYLRSRWRGCQMRNLIVNWQQCVKDLDDGFESVGCHWMEPPATPPGQFIWAGTFFWAKASFLLTLPSIMERDRIKVSGIAALESRYESEVWIGNGPRRPKIKDYHGPLWNPGKIGTCIP